MMNIKQHSMAFTSIVAVTYQYTKSKTESELVTQNMNHMNFCNKVNMIKLGYIGSFTSSE